MNAYNKILEKYGLTYDDLDKPGFSGERETLEAWATQLSKRELSMADVVEHVDSMLYAVELELVKEPEYIKILFFRVPNQKNILLKARLHNYLVLKAFLSGPGRAKKAVERAIGNLQVKK